MTRAPRSTLVAFPVFGLAAWADASNDQRWWQGLEPTVGEFVPISIQFRR
jgi:hypothetical protein